MTNWIKNAIKSPGSLHRMLNVPEGDKIPGKKMEQAVKSKNSLERKRAVLAKTLSKFHK